MVRLLQRLGLRPHWMRLEPYTAGERDFEEWLQILGDTFGTYEEQRRQGYQLRTRPVVDRELNFQPKAEVRSKAIPLIITPYKQRSV